MRHSGRLRLGRPSSCVASALWPERVTGLVSYAGYDIIDIARLGHAFEPALEQVIWYQNCFSWSADASA